MAFHHEAREELKRSLGVVFGFTTILLLIQVASLIAMILSLGGPGPVFRQDGGNDRIRVEIPGRSDTGARVSSVVGGDAEFASELKEEPWHFTTKNERY